MDKKRLQEINELDCNIDILESDIENIENGDFSITDDDGLDVPISLSTKGKIKQIIIHELVDRLNELKDTFKNAY